MPGRRNEHLPKVAKHRHGVESPISHYLITHILRDWQRPPSPSPSPSLGVTSDNAGSSGPQWASVRPWISWIENDRSNDFVCDLVTHNLKPVNRGSRLGFVKRYEI
jgi:hypothetical protein